MGTVPIDISYDCDLYFNDDLVANFNEGSGEDSDGVPMKDNWHSSSCQLLLFMKIAKIFTYIANFFFSKCLAYLNFSLFILDKI